MAAFGTGGNRALPPGRGPSPGFRFTLYALLSIVLMFVDQRAGDQRGSLLQQARSLLLAAAYPIQLAVSSPSAAWQWLKENAQTREALRAENERLRAERRELALRALRYEALARENAHLRGLREAIPPVAERWLAAEIVNVEPNNLRQRVLINRGTRNGVFKGQVVLDEHGVLGQTMRVGPWSAEVILVTDPEHAIPVQIDRTGVRTIAVGAGESGELALPYLPANADIREGDLLVTSGLGGVFPAGYPVARVTEVHRDAIQPLAQVRAVPTGRLDRDREVMLVWFREGHPAAPVAGTALKAGNPAFQPQPVARQAEAPAAAPAAAPTPTPKAASTRASRQPKPEPQPAPARAAPESAAPEPPAASEEPASSEERPASGEPAGSEQPATSEQAASLEEAPE